MAANVFSDDRKTSLREARLIIRKVFLYLRKCGHKSLSNGFCCIDIVKFFLEYSKKLSLQKIGQFLNCSFLLRGNSVVLIINLYAMLTYIEIWVEKSFPVELV